jgi:hypothetical protein
MPSAASTPPEPESTLTAKAERIGKLRDAVLVLATIVYLLGYLSWALYAGTNDLGLVPALDTQYFVAGVLPVLVLAVGIVLALLQLRFVKWSNAEPSPARLTSGNVILAAGAVLIVLGVLAGKVLPQRINGGAEAATITGAYVAMAGAVLQGARSHPWLRLYSLGIIWLVVIFIPLLLFLEYSDKVFPHLPASLGGPAPRCVSIDLATQEVSGATSAVLVAGGDSTGSPIRHTRPLMLVFDGPQFAMLRVKDDGPKGPTYAIAKHAVMALTPCLPDSLVARQAGSRR